MWALARFGVSMAAKVSAYHLPNTMSCVGTHKLVAWTNDSPISHVRAPIGYLQGCLGRGPGPTMKICPN